MKISVSSYSFSGYIRQGKMTQLDTVKAAAELGFEGIEFTSLSPNSSPTKEEKLDYARKIKAEAEKYGIAIVAYCVGARLFNLTTEENEAALAAVLDDVDIAAELGAPIMRHDVTWSVKFGENGEKTVSFDHQLPMIAENARKITEYAAKKGIRTCSENHGFVAQDSDRVERLYNAVGHENYGILVDVGNFACADEDSVTAVSRLAPYAIHVHAKDFRKAKFGEESDGLVTRGCNFLHGCVIGEGDIPTAQCMAILKKAGYDGFVSIEYEGSDDCVEALSKGLTNLRSYI